MGILESLFRVIVETIVDWWGGSSETRFLSKDILAGFVLLDT